MGYRFRRAGAAVGCAALSIAGLLAFTADPAGASTHADKPVVTGVESDGAASSGTGGTARVTVTGDGFRHVQAVLFGSKKGSDLTVVSSHKLRVTAPKHTIAEVHVRVTTSAGKSEFGKHNVWDFQQRTALAGGVSHSCAVSASTGRLRCWGDNSSGQLGIGSGTGGTDSPVVVASIDDVVSVTAGQFSTCALRADGEVLCWGDDTYGELGNGSASFNGFSTPQHVKLGARALAVATGGNSTCAVLVGNTVDCWGSNNYGQLGDGTMTQRTSPVAVHHLSSVTSLSVAGYSACAVRSDGTERCWGDNADGQLGNGTETSSSVPTKVLGVTKAVATSSGVDDTCLRSRTGTVKCWGRNDDGELGNGTTTDSSTPVPVTGIADVSKLAVGGFQACALAGGTVKCWGLNANGQLGNGTDNGSTTPVVVALSGVAALGGAFEHSLAMLSDGTIEAWGRNDHGQLGDGTTDDSNVPVMVG